MPKKSPTVGVYIQGPAFYLPTARVFKDNGYSIVDSIEESDIVVLTGGGDISPKWYGQEPIPGTYYSDGRDRVDHDAIMRGHKLGKFMVGLCRGAQFLNVTINDGGMFQDVDGHTNGYHTVRDHVTEKVLPDIITVHHQMMIPSEEAVIVATANESTVRRDDKGLHIETDHDDPEVLWYPGTRSLLFQGHPEFGHPPTTRYFFELMDRYYKEQHQS